MQGPRLVRNEDCGVESGPLRAAASRCVLGPLSAHRSEGGGAGRGPALMENPACAWPYDRKSMAAPFPPFYR